MVEPWRLVFRASAPLLPRAGLLALRVALAADDPSLLQGATTEPPPLDFLQDWPAQGACPWAYCGWKDGLTTAGEINDFFAEVCSSVDVALGEPAGCRHFMQFVDDTPRDRMRPALLAEVELYLSQTEENAP